MSYLIKYAFLQSLHQYHLVVTYPVTLIVFVMGDSSILSVASIDWNSALGAQRLERESASICG
jgi:hypothetical protein